MIRYIPIALLVLLAGCSLFTRTIYVPDGQSVRLRAPIKRAAIWVKTESGETVADTMTLPEGWFCLADPGK